MDRDIHSEQREATQDHPSIIPGLSSIPNRPDTNEYKYTRENSLVHQLQACMKIKDTAFSINNCLYVSNVSLVADKTLIESLVSTLGDLICFEFLIRDKQFRFQGGIAVFRNPPQKLEGTRHPLIAYNRKLRIVFLASRHNSPLLLSMLLRRLGYTNPHSPHNYNHLPRIASHPSGDMSSHGHPLPSDYSDVNYNIHGHLLSSGPHTNISSSTNPREWAHNPICTHPAVGSSLEDNVLYANLSSVHGCLDVSERMPWRVYLSHPIDNLRFNLSTHKCPPGCSHSSNARVECEPSNH